MGIKSKTANEKLRETILSYLKTHNAMTLATTQDNVPWAAAVFYANDGFTLYYLSDPDTRHSMNIAEDSIICSTIYEDYDDYREIKGIQMEAKAEPVTAEDELAKAVKVYIEKYPDVSAYLKLMMTPFPKVVNLLEKALVKLPGTPDFTTPFPARFYKVIPSKIHWIDNEKSFGKRQELIL